MSRSVVVVLVGLVACGVPEGPPSPGEVSPPPAEPSFIGPVAPQPRPATVVPGGADPKLFVSRFSPHQGAPGTRVTLVGSGFSLRDDENHVVFGGPRCGVEARVLSSNAGLIEFEVPEFASTGELTVVVGDQQVVTDEAFVVLHQPVLYAVEPAAVPLFSAQAVVTIRGDGFVGAPAVTLDGVALKVMERSLTGLTALVTPRLLQHARVATLAVEGAPTTLDFTIENPAPGEATVTPAVVHSRIGEVSVTAQGMTPASVVLIDHQPVPTQWSGAALVAQLPALASGSHLVMVQTPRPGGGVGAPAMLTVMP